MKISYIFISKGAKNNYYILQIEKKTNKTHENNKTVNKHLHIIYVYDTKEIMTTLKRHENGLNNNSNNSSQSQKGYTYAGQMGAQ